ncbi:MAG: hypothetical protein IIA83_08105 [Thaumarchaeota archaeon]|nr:hypothetical protein [Nitrososphaerota archaeon]
MSYSAKAGCTNCNHEWGVQIPKGTARDDWKEKAVCPKCGVSGQVWTSPV